MEASGLGSWQSYGGSSLTNTKHKRIANSELLKTFSSLLILRPITGTIGLERSKQNRKEIRKRMVLTVGS